MAGTLEPTQSGVQIQQGQQNGSLTSRPNQNPSMHQGTFDGSNIARKTRSSSAQMLHGIDFTLSFIEELRKLRDKRVSVVVFCICITCRSDEKR